MLDLTKVRNYQLFEHDRSPIQELDEVTSYDEEQSHFDKCQQEEISSVV